MFGIVLVSLRDLQWRRRRFVISAIGTAVVFALTLLLGCVVSSLNGEVDRTLDGLGADEFVFPASSSSPFYGMTPFPVERTTDVAAARRAPAAPALFLRQAVALPGDEELTDVFIIGHVPGGPGSPPVVDGRAPTKEGEIALDRAADLDVGSTVPLSGRTFTIVGRTKGRTLSAGNPTAYVLLDDIHNVLLRGVRLATMALVSGGDKDAPLPAEFRSFDATKARDDILRPTANAITSLRVLQVLLWLVAATIVGSVMYLSVLERTRDFAVFKATGAGSGRLALGLFLQATCLGLVASLVAIVLARVLSPLFPLAIQLPAGQVLMAPVVGIAVALLASTVGLRRAVAIDPALAFGR